MYNLIERSLNYSETTGSLWFYSKAEETNFYADIANNNFKSFEYNVKLLENTEPDGTNVIYLSNFWRSLEMPLINCKLGLKFKWIKSCVLSAAGVDDVVLFSLSKTQNYMFLL